MKIDNRSQMIYALTEVAQLEHTLMCQYLFAGASLKSTIDELPNVQRQHHQLELIREWKKQLYIVAREEMQHLTYAINLLISVGGSPTFARPNFPNYHRFYKTPATGGVEMKLEKFGPAAIERFIRLEAPPEKAAKVAAAVIPDPNIYDTLHEFYMAIKDGFTEDMFVNYGNQYDPLSEDEDNIRVGYRKGINNIVSSVKEAQALIDRIIEEGEGSPGTSELAHVNKFRKIEEDLENEMKEDPQFDPSRPVLANPMTRIHDDIDEELKKYVNVIEKKLDNGIPHDLLQLFNGAYEILLTWLFQVFDRHGSKEELRAIETLVFMPFMTEVLRPLMEIVTLYPVKTDKIEGNLGPGFEVTSNTFLIPKPEITHKLTVERFTALQKYATDIMAAISQHHLPDPKTEAKIIADLQFVAKSISLLQQEFESRIVHPWKPKPKENSPTDMQYSETSPRGWVTEGFHVLELKFQGWAQCRLASDPDGAFEKRGVTGNNFALSTEPDLDNVIYFQKAGAVQRSYCPEIGVFIKEAAIISMPYGNNKIDAPSLVNGRINLLGKPKFQGRNHIVSEDGEPIDPFEVSVETDSGINFKRAVIGNGLINDMTPVQRRGTGRFPVKLALGKDAATEYLKRLDIQSPHKLLDERIANLQAALDSIPGDKRLEAEAVHLKFRLDFLDVTKRASLGEPVREGIRWKRFFFDAAYRHTISGDMKLNNVPKEITIVEQDSPQSSQWLIEYNFGFFDSDALCSYVYGNLKIPVKI